MKHYYTAIEARRDLCGTEIPEKVAELVGEVRHAVKYGYRVVYYLDKDPNVIKQMESLGYRYMQDRKLFYW